MIFFRTDKLLAVEEGSRIIRCDTNFEARNIVLVDFIDVTIGGEKLASEISTRTNLISSVDSKIISCSSQTGTASAANSEKAVAKETSQSTQVGDTKNSNSSKQKPNLPNDDDSSSEDEEKKEELEKECGTNKAKRKNKPEKDTEKEQKQKRSVSLHFFYASYLFLLNFLTVELFLVFFMVQ